MAQIIDYARKTINTTPLTRGIIGPMKVFYLFNHPAPYKIDFFNELGKLCDLTVVLSRDEEKGRNQIFYSHKPENFKLEMAHALPIGTYNCISSYPAKHLKKNAYDVVVINGYATFAEMKAIRYLRRKKIPYIIEINGGIIAKRESFFKKRLKTRYIKGADIYLAPDENSKGYLVYYGAEEEKVFLYPYSSVHRHDMLKAPLGKEEKEAIRKEYGLPSGTLYSTSGFFYPRKNFLRLIELYAKLKDDSHLLLVGEGEEKEAIEQKIAELHLEDKVILRPFVEHKELLHILSSTDAFLFLTKEDIYGHVIVEALSQGLPVVSSSFANAASRLIIDGENGYVVDYNDEEATLKAFKEVLNPSFPKKAIEIASQFVIEEEAAFHIRFFEKFLGKGE